MEKRLKIKEYDLKATKELLKNYLEKRLENLNINLPPNTVIIDDLKRKETLNRLYKLIDDLIEKIYTNGRPSFYLPSRSSSNIIWDEKNDLLLLGKQIMEKQFHTLTSVADITRLMKILEIIHELLNKNDISQKDMFIIWMSIYLKNKKIVIKA